MSTLGLTLKMFRHNLKSELSYLLTLIVSVAMFYNFAILQFSPEMLGGPNSRSSTVVMCATLMSIVMIVVFFSFVWSSSGFFLRQRKKEVGLYALCGVPSRRIGRVFLLDGLLSGALALVLGLGLGLLLTKFFLMGAAFMIKLERSVPFSFSLIALLETLLVMGAVFLVASLRSAAVVQRSKLIDLLQGMRAAEQPPKRRVVRAVLAVLALTVGYALSVVPSLNRAWTALILLFAVPILVLVIAGTYWAFEALLPAVLGLLTKSKNFFYRGVRMVGISNLRYRLRTNYRNLALTSVLSATAIVTLCVALTMSDFVGAREGKYDQRLLRAFSVTGWMAPEDIAKFDALAEENGIAPSDILHVPCLLHVDAEGNTIDVTMELSAAKRAAEQMMPFVNLEVPELSIADGDVLWLLSPNSSTFDLRTENVKLPIEIAGKEVARQYVPDLWFFGGNERVHQLFILPDGWFEANGITNIKPRAFVGLTAGDVRTSALQGAASAALPNASIEINQALTTEKRMMYGTMAYLGLILFVVFSLATGCALLFKQLGEAAADRPKYQSMVHLGATRQEIARAVGVQVGLSLLVPLLLGFVHAAFAVRVMGMLFALDTLAYLMVSLGVYALVVLALFGVTMHRFMRVVT